MNFVDTIEKKRDGQTLSKNEIQLFVDGVMDGGVEDCQIGAFLMEITEKGLSSEEAFYLSMALAKSGKCYALGEKDPKFVDKHSTGGVSDSCTLIVLPVLAALGYKVAKYSTSGVGASFGTLDRLGVFDGYKPCIDEDLFFNCLNKYGLSIIGNVDNIIPADRKLYEIRKKTGTVPSVPLIACSIMAKKFAMGAKIVVLDVKCGEGSLLNDIEQADYLAKLMVQIGKMGGVATSAIISNVNQPLGTAIGPMLEVKEAVEVLKNNKAYYEKDLYNLCREMVTHILISSGETQSRSLAYEKFDKVIKNGAALNKLIKMVESHGGNTDRIVNTGMLVPTGSVIYVTADKKGYVSDVETKGLYQAINIIGANKDGTINRNVGVEVLVREGEKVEFGQKLAKIYYSISDPTFASAVSYIKKCFVVSKDKPEPQNLINKIIV